MSDLVTPDSYEGWVFYGLRALRQNVERASVDDLLALTDGKGSMFGSRRKLAETLGVGESTIAGWVKEGTLPPLAKWIVCLIRLSEQAREEVLNNRSENRELGDVIVRDGDGYMIVHFAGDPSFREPDGSTSVGEIAARGIPDRQTAQRLVSHGHLRDALKTAVAELRDAVEKDANMKAGVFEHSLLFEDMMAHLEQEAGVERPDDGLREL